MEETATKDAFDAFMLHFNMDHHISNAAINVKSEQRIKEMLRVAFWEGRNNGNA